MACNCLMDCSADEKDDYDAEFDRMREATMKSRQEKAREELESTAQSIEDLKKKLSSAREQVLTCYILHFLLIIHSSC